MKKALFLIILLVGASCLALNAQNTVLVYPILKGMPQNVEKAFIGKLENIVSSSGMAISDYCSRLAIVASIDVEENDVIPSVPPKVSKRMTLILSMEDVCERHVFSSYSLTLSGIGASDAKAFISAFSHIDKSKVRFWVEDTMTAIGAFYSRQRNLFELHYELLKKEGKYEEAVAYMLSIPADDPITAKWYQDKAIAAYSAMTEDESKKAYVAANAAWTKQMNQDGANAALDYLTNVNPASSIYPQALKLWKQISLTLSKDKQREYEFAMRKYEDKQAFRKNIVDMLLTVGKAFGEHQTPRITEIIKYH